MVRRYAAIFFLVSFAGLTVLLYSTMGISQQRTPPAPDTVQEAQTPRQDTVEFFDLVLLLQLNEQEKRDLVAFMGQL
jgi:hypothetical protein